MLVELSEFGKEDGENVPMKIERFAQPKGIAATTGLAQLTSLLAVHPNQNRLMGIKKQPMSAG